MNAVAPISANPFPGLRPFNEDEEHLFFGRERQVDGMVDKLGAAHFLAVVGTSGSGKSSLVNCGLRPALHRGLMAQAGTRWWVAQFRPGNKPVRALAEALVRAMPGRHDDTGPFSPADFVEATLRSTKLGLIDAYEQAGIGDGTNLLVVADQFEELFRYAGLAGTPGSTEAVASEDATVFVNLLLNAANQRAIPIYVVLTMRSDFLGDCAQYFGLPEAINGGQYLVPRLTRDERRLAIVGPIGVSGAQISPVLLTRLVNDVGDNPDQLSILQHALNRTWARWSEQAASDSAIDLPHYESIGTMAHALDQHAEEAFAELGSEVRQALCERIFKALTDRSTDTRGVRRPTRMDVLCVITASAESEIRAVIDLFRRPGRAFLMPPAADSLLADSVIDISHESLMRVWERLRRWAGDESESAKTYLRLASDAERHTSGTEGLLWDPALQTALDWRQRQAPNSAWAAQYHPGFAQAMRYLDDSEAARAVRNADARRDARRKRLTRVMLVAFGLALGVLLYVSWFKAEQADLLTAERDRALASQWVAQAHASLSAGRIDRALLFTLEARKTKRIQEADAIILTALQEAPQFVLTGHMDEVSGVAFSPDSRTLASASNDGEVRLWNVTDGALRRALQPTRPQRMSALAYSHDGAQLFSVGGFDDAGTVWDIASGARRGPSDGRTEPAWAVAMDIDHRLIVTASGDTISLWDQASGQRRSIVKRARSDRVSALAISPGAGWIAVADNAGGVELMNTHEIAEGRQRPVSLQGHSSEVDAITFSPDGALLASTSMDGTVILSRVADGLQVAPPQPGFIDKMLKDRTPSVLAFSPDSRLLAWAGSNGTVVTWETPDLRYRQVVQGHQGPVERIVFSPDSTMLASAGRDGVVRLWDVAKGAAQLAPVGRAKKGHAGRVSSLAFSSDGHWLASGDRDAVLIWDVSRTRSWRGALKFWLQSISCVAFSPDGRTIASGNEEGSITLWSVTSDVPVIAQLQDGHDEPVESVAFSPDGRRLASASRDMTVLLWDTATGRRIGQPLAAHTGQLTTVAFRPTDGKVLASGGRDEKVILWDAIGGRPIGAPIEHGGKVLSVAFSPDGNTLAVAGRGESVKLWDVSNPAAVTLRRELRNGQKDDLTSLSFSPDGRSLASGSLDGTAVLWDVDSGTQRHLAAMRHAKGIWSVAISPDGKALATASLDETVRFWSVDNGQPLTEPLTGHRGRVWSASFSPNGETLATAGADQIVMLWDADVTTWERRACRIANRNLRPEEWPQWIKSEDWSPRAPPCPTIESPTEVSPTAR